MSSLEGCLHAAAGRCRDESAAARLRAYLRVVVVHDVAISPVIAHKSNLGAPSIVSQGPSIEAYDHLGRRDASISTQVCATRRAMPVSPPCQSAADHRRNRHTASRRRQRRLPLFNVPVSGLLTGPRSAGRRQAFFLPPPCRSRGVSGRARRTGPAWASVAVPEAAQLDLNDAIRQPVW
jgi:hypothetical protein